MGTPIIQQWINRAPPGSVIEVPAGYYELDTIPIIVNQSKSLVARDGWFNIVCTKDIAAPIVVQDCQDSTIRGVSIEVNDTIAITAGVSIAGTGNTGVLFDRVRVCYGQSGERIKYGFVSDGGDGGNDFHTFRRCYVRGASISGWWQRFGQNTDWHLDKCTIQDCNVGFRGASHSRLDRVYFAACEIDLQFDRDDAVNMRGVTMVNCRSEMPLGADSAPLSSGPHIHSDAMLRLDATNCGVQAGMVRMINLLGPLLKRVTMRNVELVHTGNTSTEIHTGDNAQTQVHLEGRATVEIAASGSGTVRTDLQP